MKTIRFTIQLPQVKKVRGKKTSVALVLPKSIRVPAKGLVPVEGVINYLPFQSTLETVAGGKSYFVLDKHVFDIATSNTPDKIMIEITKMGNESETRVPADLNRAFAKAPKARNTWDDITPLARRDWIFWMITAKQEETRARRIEKMCDMLSSGKRRVCCFAGVAWLMRHHPKKASRRTVRK